jgi:hypothetical protein
MALTPQRLRVAEETRLDVIEAALLQEAAHCETLPTEDRAALSNQLTDLAMRYQWRATELAKLAQKVQPPGWFPPDLPR